MDIASRTKSTPPSKKPRRRSCRCTAIAASTAGVVFADNLIVTPAATDDDTVAVMAGRWTDRVEGAVLGRIANMGLTVVRVDGLNRPALAAGA